VRWKRGLEWALNRLGIPDSANIQKDIRSTVLQSVQVLSDSAKIIFYVFGLAKGP